MKAELTKGDVYVVVDTPKKAKKLKNLLDMFKETMFTIPNNEWSSHNGTDYGWGYGFSNELWQGFNTKSIAHNGKKFKKVSIKELRNILAKENLMEGDYVVCDGNNIVKIKSISGDRIYVDKELFLDTRNVYTEGFESISSFKRYATTEEIDLLEPKEVDKFAELKEAESKGKVLECKAIGFCDSRWILKTHKDFVDKLFEYRIKPEDPVKVGDWMFNPNSKKITQVKKENHGKSLIGSGWIKIKDTELIEKLNSL